MELINYLKNAGFKPYRLDSRNSNIAKHYFEDRKYYSKDTRAYSIALAIKASCLFDFVSRPFVTYNGDTVSAILLIDYKTDTDIIITCGESFNDYFIQISTFKGGSIK